MKNFILILFIVPLGLLSQNLKDAYENHQGEHYFQEEDDIADFNGEYQIFLDKLYWHMDTKYTDAAKSLSIQVVSFPFIPKVLDDNDVNASNMHNSDDRVFAVQQMNGYDYGYLEQTGSQYSYKGLGWQYGNWKIYSKINNTDTCGSGYNHMCNGDYGLLSAGFVEPILYNWYDDCWLPHTILKHTIYFHCGSDITDPIIDSIYWLYDNTRGKMKTYPFAEENGSDNTPLINDIVDVSFRPTFINAVFFYGELDSNAMIYSSGYNPNSGSVNYFPPEEVRFQYNCCEDYPLYYNPNAPGGGYQHDNQYYNPVYEVDFVHPPEYALFDAPLLNYKGNTWAGYDGSSFAIEQPGMNHKYEINESIDLRIINPVEKIIYNPSYVYINVDLVFPCDYKFLTLHGKYPDKNNEVLDYYNDYWSGKGVYFGYERNYPTPVYYETNAEYMSTYEIKPGKTVLLEPNVIIMNVLFKGEEGSGKSYLAFDPDHKLGNWEYDETTIKVIVLEYNGIDCDYFIPPHGEDSLKDASLSGNENIESDLPNNTYLSIYNDGYNTVHIRSNALESMNNILLIYNSYGHKICEIKNPPKDYYLNTSDYSSGFYIAILHIGGQKSESAKFFVK